VRGENNLVVNALKATGRGIVREHCDIYTGGRKIGETASGTFCACLKGEVQDGSLDSRTQ